MGLWGRGVRVPRGGPASIAGGDPAGASQVDVASRPGDQQSPLLQQDTGDAEETS